MDFFAPVRVARRIFADLIAPPRCVGCGAEQRFPGLCPRCLAGIPRADQNICPFCRRPSKNFMLCGKCRETAPIRDVIQARGPSPALRRAVHALKYRFTPEAASQLADLVADAAKNLPPTPRKTIAVPVPLHPRRARWRGFNQAEKIAEKLPFPAKNLLVRNRATPRQAGLDRTTRLENLAGAFSVIPDQNLGTTPPRVVLIDDILTTGSTLAECARELASHGYQDIVAIVLARGTK